VFVPELEVEAYRKTGCRDVVGVPNQVRGITATRNWILDATPERRVVFVDDDVKAVGWVEFHHHYSVTRRLKAAEMVEEWRKLFELTEALGYRVWGVATESGARSTYPYRPFLWHTYITASCMGILNGTGLRFDESFPVKEDYELGLRALKEDGGVVGARYLFWMNEHWRQAGGCSDYRTQAMEEDVIRRLMQMYPGYVRRIERRESDYGIRLFF
jgi:hypothetical protein